MKTVYFVRHGETNGNASNQYQFPHTPLSEKGRAQAQLVAERFRTIPHDLVIMSPMARAKETAEAIIAFSRAPSLECPELHERLYPSITWGKGKEDADVTPIIAHVKKHFFSHDDSVKHSNEELFKDVLARAQHVVALIESRPEQRIVVVTHREILRFMIMYLLFKEKATPDIYLLIREHFIHANTGITKCIQGKKGWELHTWSDESHLG